MAKYFTSNAEWPESAGCRDKYGMPFSSDRHTTEKDAAAVCVALQKDGYGGQGKIFPVRTWVGDLCTDESSGWCKKKGRCKYKLPCGDGTAGCERAL